MLTSIKTEALTAQHSSQRHLKACCVTAALSSCLHSDSDVCVCVCVCVCMRVCVSLSVRLYAFV